MPLLFETVGYNKKGFKFIFISVTPKVSEMAPILGEDKDHFTDDVFKSYLQLFIQQFQIWNQSKMRFLESH